MKMRSNIQGIRWCAPPLTDSQLTWLSPCIEYHLWIKNVCFQQGLKLVNEGMGVMNMRWYSLFQKIGAITEKARSPYLVIVRGPRVNCKVDDDRIRGLKELEQRKEISSERYIGAWPWIILYVKRRTLNVIRWCVGSQWRERNIGGYVLRISLESNMPCSSILYSLKWKYIGMNEEGQKRSCI